MWLVAGLGNPGPEYANTRHNVGWWVVDSLAAAAGDPIQWKRRAGCVFCKLSFGDHQILLVKPELYMNRSGTALVPLLSYFKVPVSKLIVAYDEVDLAVGALRLRQGGSAGGHRGIQDILRQVGSDEFYRIRIGVGRPTDESVEPESEYLEFNPANKSPKGGNISSWVLSPPRPKEKELLIDAISRATKAIETLVSEGLETAQREFNSSPRKKKSNDSSKP